MKKLLCAAALLLACCGEDSTSNEGTGSDDTSKPGSGNKPRKDGAAEEDSSTSVDSSVADSEVNHDSSLVETDAGAAVSDSSVVDSSMPDSATVQTLDGDWIVQLNKTSATCSDSTVVYEDYWTIEGNGSELVSLDYYLTGTSGNLSSTMVNSKVSVQLYLMDGHLRGTHLLEALNVNGTVRCYVSRSVNGERDHE